MILISMTRKLGLLIYSLLCATSILSSVEGSYSNTVLYPVSEDARARAASGGTTKQTANSGVRNSNNHHRHQPGAPSRYLEYEGPDATYQIRLGTHPTISYPNLEKFPDTQIRIRYDLGSNNKSHKKGVFFADDCPRHFLWLSDKAVKSELDHRVLKGKWSERVMVEKTYFTLFYGGTGLASQYMDSVDDFQTDLQGWEVMNRSSNHCNWEGVECLHSSNIDKNRISSNGFVVGFSINGFSLEGTLPHDLYVLSHLRRLDLRGNRIQGSLPASWGKLTNLEQVDLGDNRLSGTIPSTLEGWTKLQSLNLSSNLLEGELDDSLVEAWTKRDQSNSNSSALEQELQNDDDTKAKLKKATREIFDLERMDLSENKFSGTFPMTVLTKFARGLKLLDLSENSFSGSLPETIPLVAHEGDSALVCQPSTDDDSEKNDCATSISGLEQLEVLNLSENSMQGNLPNDWIRLPALKVLNLSHNQMKGPLPQDVWMATSLERLALSYNKLTGEIPNWEEKDEEEKAMNLQKLFLNNNQLSGTIPHDVFKGLGVSLQELYLGSNRLVGKLPSSLSKMTKLVGLDVHGNQLTGKLPHEMNQMLPNLRLNLTDNNLIGTVPKLFCGGGAASTNLLFRQFGCDAILCPAGTFHPNGAASLYSGCRPCPVQKGDDEISAKALGRRRCGDDDNKNRTTFVHGDLNGDGILSEREILRLLYTYTKGQNWGTQFENWAETNVDKCDLNGVTCVDGKVAKIDLTDASLCASADRKKAAPWHECKGIPAELSKLTELEILTMNRRQFLRGTLPTEIGEMENLKYLDISSCPYMTGPLPSEIGRLTNLKYLNIGGCRFNGTIPEEIFDLEGMEKLHLSLNSFTGTVPSAVAKMTNLKELLLSRTYVNGTIPEGVGELTALENFEMYGNQLTGPIPESLGQCTNLKRIDLFNNKLTGTIPESLTDIRALQILHIKLNHLSGTISSGFGRLPSLSWFDVSTNHLHGTIPESFGQSKTLKDFRLGGGNMIHNPIPKSLCSNTNINGGLTKMYGCAGVICPLGTYSDPGHATKSDGCKPCPNGRTTTYLGSSRCVELTEEDILTMFYDVMAASNTFPMQEKHWKFDREGPVCTWNGVKCDDNDSIESIWFPLLELNAAD